MMGYILLSNEWKILIDVICWISSYENLLSSLKRGFLFNLNIVDSLHYRVEFSFIFANQSDIIRAVNDKNVKKHFLRCSKAFQIKKWIIFGSFHFEFYTLRFVKIAAAT